MHNPKHTTSASALFLCNIIIIIGASVFALTKNVYFSMFVVFLSFITGLLYFVVMLGKKKACININEVSNDDLLSRFKKIGYYTRLVTQINDKRGTGIVLEKRGVKTFVHYKPHIEKICVKTMERTIQAMHYYAASQSILITGSPCSADARVLANTNSVEVWDEELFQEFIKRTDPTHDLQSPTRLLGTCPLCLGKMEHYGQSFRCVSYPVCTYMRKLT